MTNWCLSSITGSTLPTPVSLLNSSILFVRLPFFSLSLFRCLSPFRVSNTPSLQSVCLHQGRHCGSLIASYFHEAKFITLTAPAHAAYFEPAAICFCIY